MKINLYDWDGAMKVSSGLYAGYGTLGDRRPHAYLEVTRAKDQVNIWLYELEEVQALLDELETIKAHLETQAQAAA